MIGFPLLLAAAVTNAPPPSAPGLTQKPELIDGAPPIYPAALIGSGKDGNCTVYIDLDAEGLVRQISVVSCDHPAFAEACFAVMPHYTFIPGATATGTVPVRITWRAQFVHPKAPKVEPAKALPVRISGKVREGGTGVVLPGADLACDQQDAHTVSDHRGAFALRGVSDGLCLLKVQAPGYHTKRQKIILKPDEAVELTVYLSPTQRNAMRSVVRGRKEETHMTRRILDAEELTRVPGTLGDPIRAVERLPGVARMPFIGGGGLVVRGANPQDTGYYIDGQPVPFLFHLGGGPSIIHPDFVSQIDFMPGGFGAEFGRAIAGIVNVKSRPASPKRFAGKIDIDLMDSGFRIEGPVSGRKDLAYGITGRRSYVDILLPILLDAAGSTGVRIQPVFWDYQARLDYKKGSERAGVRVYGVDDVLNIVAGDAESQARAGSPPGIGIHTTFHRFAADWRKKLSPQTEARAAFHLGQTTTGGSIGDNLIFWDLSIQQSGLRADIEHRFKKNIHFINGIDLGMQRFATASRFPAIATIERTFPARALGEDPALQENRENDSGYGIGLHSTVRAKPWRWLTVLPGVRFDSYYWTGQQRLSLEPRLQIRVALAKKDRHLLKFAGGKYSRLPEPPELSRSVGNPELALKGAWQYGVGYTYRPDPFFHFDITTFYKNIFHLIGQNPDFVVGGTAPRLLSNSHGRAYGLEVMLRHRPSPRPIYGWLAYTLSRSEHTHGDRPEEGFTLFDLDQTHILSSVIGYKWGQGWSLGVTTRWVTGNPETERVGARFDVDLQVYHTVFGEPKSARRPAFFQTDLRLEKRSAKKRRAFTWYIDIMNLTNHSNIEFFIYQYDRRAYSGIAGIPFFPSFGMELSW